MKGSTQVAPLFVVAIVSLFLLFVPSTDAVLSCNAVIQTVAPCVNYLINGSEMPSSACCSGVRALVTATNTTADRQAACSCLESTSQNLNLNLTLVASIPTNCGINLGFTISPDVDCTTIT
ncbi:non-specific lipid-transfer protein 1-like [Cynara cardunculus var. scolymus]|uniref:non-specific lipid-transfer protein 1-like n=1 Tax=Cynara cardunculus var. scolymus TaxID=59895 RepID=UPI000D62FDCA|nr:non-specific lipid-transfer protein 1-like [Cynara cardunculus var. scolymus]